MSAAPSRAVLVTGCSTGIGHATALRLARGGWTVYATARRLESIADLEPAGCRLLELDVTDDASAEAAVRTVVEAEGAVGEVLPGAAPPRARRGRRSPVASATKADSCPSIAVCRFSAAAAEVVRGAEARLRRRREIRAERLGVALAEGHAAASSAPAREAL